MDIQTRGYEMPEQTIFERQMEELKSDMREMRAAITQVATAMSKLAVLEERNISITSEVNRLSSRVQTVETKTVEMELHRAKFDGSLTGATTTARIIWAIGGGAVAYLAAPLLKIIAGH